MPDRDVVSTFDAILENASQAIQASPEYIRRELEAHFRKFPKEKRDNFMRNLYQKVEDNRNIFLGKLIGAFSLMKENYVAGRYDLDLWKRNIDVSISSLGEMLQSVTPGTDSYNYIDRLRQEIVVLGRILKRPEAVTPRGYENWKHLGGGIWRRDTPGYTLIVQEVGKSYFSTVKDIGKGRVYSDATPYPTLEQAMQKATTRAAHATHEQATAPPQSGYTMPSNGKQRRLF